MLVYRRVPIQMAEFSIANEYQRRYGFSVSDPSVLTHPKSPYLGREVCVVPLNVRMMLATPPKKRIVYIYIY